MSQLPGQYTTSIYRGDTFRRKMLWKVDGAPVDLTDVQTLLAQIRTDIDGTLVDSFAATVLSDPTLGIIQLELTAAQTAALTPDDCLVSDVEITWDTGDVQTFLVVKMIVVGDVTV